MVKQFVCIVALLVTLIALGLWFDQSSGHEQRRQDRPDLSQTDDPLPPDPAVKGEPPLRETLPPEIFEALEREMAKPVEERRLAEMERYRALVLEALNTPLDFWGKVTDPSLNHSTK